MDTKSFSCDCNVIHLEAVKKAVNAMPAEEALYKVANFFKVLGDPTRTKILSALDASELCVCDLANVLDMTKSAVSHQLGLLRRANLVKFRRDGKNVFYALADEHVRIMIESGLEHVNE